MTDTIIPRSTAIDRMRDGLLCETCSATEWFPTRWEHFDPPYSHSKFRIPPEPRRKALGYLCVDKDNRPARSANLAHNEYHVAFVYKHSPHIPKLLDVAWPANAPHRLVPVYASLEKEEV